jgi:hypothetical protein
MSTQSYSTSLPDAAVHDYAPAVVATDVEPPRYPHVGAAYSNELREAARPFAPRHAEIDGLSAFERDRVSRLDWHNDPNHNVEPRHPFVQGVKNALDVIAGVDD